MTRYVLQRLVLLPVLLFVFSVTVFAIVQAPPGDFLTAYTATLASSGTSISAEHLEALRKEYGLDQPVHVGGRDPRGHLLGHAPALGPRLRVHRAQLRRRGHAELHARARAHVDRV